MGLRYRAAGADGPFGDPRRGHGIAMEGYFWRLSEPRSGRVIVALAGVCIGPQGPWANVALAAHPGGLLVRADVAGAWADPDGLGVQVGDGVLVADASRLSVDLGPGARMTVHFADRAEWPRRRALGGLGPAHLIPGLGQYWHPHLLGARASGTAELGTATVELDGFDAYGEKNWGAGGFPRRWWWGQAQGFERDDVCVAFAGGTLAAGRASVEASGLVVRLGDDVIRLGNPLLAPARVSAREGRWRITARGPRWGATLDGTARGEPHQLEIPLPAEGHSVAGARQHLAADVRLTVRRRGRIAFSGVSEVAGLELGTRDRPG